jgi:hypothetical protein
MKIELAKLNTKRNSNNFTPVKVQINNYTKSDNSRTSPNINSDMNFLHGSINTKYTKFENETEEKEEIKASIFIFNFKKIIRRSWKKI